MAADVNEIISKEAIEGLKKANQYFIDLDGNIKKVIEESKAFNTSFRTISATQETIVSGQKKMQTQTEKMTQIQKDEAKALKEVENAAKALDRQRQAGLATMAKEEAKQREYNSAEQVAIRQKKQLTEDMKRLNKEGEKRTKEIEKEIIAQNKANAAIEKAIAKDKDFQAALKLEVKTLQDAQKQNAALTQARKTLDLTTKQGQATLAQYNATLDKNTKFIRNNSDEAGKQRMNIGNYGSALNGLKTLALGAVGALGLTGGLAGAIKFVGSVIQSSESLSDKWEKTTTGLTFAWDSFKTSIANSDFSNLLTNMNNAIKAGREYAETMDLLEDKRRGVTIQEAELGKQLSELRIKMNNVNLTEKGRIAYADAIIEKEKEIALAKEGINKQDLDATYKAITAKKNINKADLEAFISFKGTTEEKVALAGEFNKKMEEYQALNYQYTNQFGTTAPKTQKQIDEINRLGEEIANTSTEIKSMANVINNISPKEIELLTQKTVDYYNAQAAVSENVEVYYKKKNKLEKADTKAIEKQVSETEKITTKISDLTSQMTELRLANKPIPDSMIHELISSQAQLENVKKEVEAIAAGMVQIQSKSAGVIPVAVAGTPLTARASVGSGGAAANAGPKDTLFGSKGEATQFAIDQAQVVADTTFQIMADSANAEFEMKLSLLEKEKQARLDVAKTEEEKAKIEAKYAKQAAKIKTEQFKKQKAADIIQAIINTALAVTRAGVLTPLGIATAIAGSAQVAIIAAQKVPQFDAGSSSTPSQFIAGERRPEFMITPSGGVQLVTKPTLFKNMAGATVIGGEETERIMNMTGGSSVDLRPDILLMKNEIVNAVKNKREIYISGSTGKITEREGNYYKEYFNRKFKC